MFFFDNVDKLIDEKTEQNWFIKFVETLLDDCPNAKVLLTCCEANHQPSQELTLSVDGMADRQDCWRIFEEQYNLIIPTE